MKAYIVDTAALQHNLEVLRKKAGNAVTYGVIKGDGYGLGLIPMAEQLRNGGVTHFAVTEVSEVAALREGGFLQEEILMLRETGLEAELEALMDDSAVVTVGSLETAETLNRLAQQRGIACPCHVKIDTGMGRYGFLPENIEQIAAVYAMEHLDVQGIYTHFHSAFEDSPATQRQFEAFQRVLEALNARKIDPRLRHCCNSSAFLKHPEMHLDGVRLGSAILGRLSFSGETELTRLGWCEAQVEVVREIPKGHSVGYGAGWTAKRPTRIAVCSVGYYHGFEAPARNDLYRFRDCLVEALSLVKAFLTRRALYMTVNGKPARVLGHVGMVQTVLDVTDIPCQVGDPIRAEIKPLAIRDLEIRYR